MPPHPFIPAEETMLDGISRLPRRRLLTAFVAATGLLITTVAASLILRNAPDQEPLAILAQRQSAVGHRPFRPRLAPPFTHVSVAALRSDGSANLSTAAELQLGAAASQYTTATDPRTAAASRLLIGDDARAVDLLQRASRHTGATADVLSDLSAALLVKADRTGTTLPAIDALAAADRALRLDSRHAPAAFNRAIALEALGLVTEATEAWQMSARLDSGSSWSAEATVAAARLQVDHGSNADWNTARAELEAAVKRNDTDVAGRIVSRHFRDARAWGESVYPSNWAEAVLNGNEAEATVQLARARVIGSALRTHGGERLLADSVHVIDALSPASPRRNSLARAYLRYRQGRMEHSRNAAGALTTLREAEAGFTSVGSPMALMARYYVGSALYSLQRLEETLEVLGPLSAEGLQGRGYIALSAQVGWERGLAILARGELSTASAIFESSMEAFESLGDQGNAATMSDFLALTFDMAGDAEQAWRIRRVALETMARSGDERRKTTALRAAVVAMLARRDWERARPLLDVVVAAASSSQEPGPLAAALAQRSATLAALGDFAGARRDLDDLHTTLRDISAPEIRAGLLVDANYAEALLARDRDPAAAVEHLTRAVAELDRAGRALFLSRIYLERSRASARLGDRPAARADIVAGLHWMERNRGSIADPQLRAMISLSAEELFEDGIALAIEDGDAGEAFKLAEHARARSLLESFASQGQAAIAPLSLADVQKALTPGSAILEYALVRDRLLIFVVTARDLRVTQQPMPDDALAGLAGLAGSRALSLQSLENAWRLLIEPVIAQLAGIDRIAVSPDRRLGMIPFAALRDARRNRFLIEDFVVMTSPSASLAILSSRRAAGLRGRSVLSIGASEFDRSRFPEAATLPWVIREAEAVAAIYGNSKLLLASNATPGAVAEAMAGADLVHYAGHSVAPAHDRTASALLLAGAGTSSTLTAREIGRLHLTRTQLVMLSSCRSAAGGEVGDGIENLATAFVVAGVPSVVGAMWDVEDQVTAELAMSFHRHYQPHGDAAIAFREAVLERKPSVEGPSWAMVTVFGGSPGLVNEGEDKR